MSSSQRIPQAWHQSHIVPMRSLTRTYMGGLGTCCGRCRNPPDATPWTWPLTRYEQHQAHPQGLRQTDKIHPELSPHLNLRPSACCNEHPQNVERLSQKYEPQIACRALTAALNALSGATTPTVATGAIAAIFPMLVLWRWK